MKRKALTSFLFLSTLLSSSAWGLPPINEEEGRVHAGAGALRMRADGQLLGRYHYDGHGVVRERVNHVEENGQRRAVGANDVDIDCHEGMTIHHVDIFSLNGGHLPNPLSGDYDFIGDLAPQNRLLQREEGRIIYSDGAGGYFFPNVTQESWRREGRFYGAFVSSHAANRKLSFIEGRRVLREGNVLGHLPAGLYGITAVDETTNERRESWQFLRPNHVDQGGDVYTITSHLGCPSIPGIGLTAPLVVPDIADQAVQNIFQRTNATQQRLEKLNDYHQAEGNIVLLGPSGRGKSTLAHILARRTLDVERTARGRRLVANGANQLPEFLIERGNVPGTQYPTIWYDRENNQNRVLIDCPGFGDVRGGEADLVNAFSINALFIGQRNIKPVLVFNESDLANRSQQLASTLDQLVSFFTNDNALYESISLVVTQLRDIDVLATLREIVDDFGRNAAIQISERGKNLLRFLSEHSERVATLPYPEREGVYHAEESVDAIEAAIGNAHYSQHAREGINLQLGAEARLLTTDLAQGLNEYMERYSRVQVVQNLVNRARSLIENHQGTVQQIRAQLTTLATYIETLGNQAPLTARTFETRLTQQIDGDPVITRTIEQLEFLNKTGANVNPAVTSWKEALRGAIERVRDLAKVPTTVPNADGSYTLQGPLVGTSDLAEIIKDKPQAKELHVFATHTLFLDQDLAAPSKSLALFSPHWVVNEKGSKVNLSGSNGINGDNGNNGAQGASGGDGKFGQSGGNGGHFYGKAFRVTHMEKLALTSNGGQGGTGGNGGPGGNGANGQDGNLSIATRSEGKQSEAFYSHEFGGGSRKVHHTWTESHYNAQGTNGQAGGNGGRQGLGGLGGQAGKIIVNFSLPEINRSILPGTLGKDGTGGAGGTGGKHGMHCKGVVCSNGTAHKHKNGLTQPAACRNIVLENKGHVDRGKAPNGKTLALTNLTRTPIGPAINLNYQEILRAYREYVQRMSTENPRSSELGFFPGLMND